MIAYLTIDLSTFFDDLTLTNIPHKIAIIVQLTLLIMILEFLFLDFFHPFNLYCSPIESVKIMLNLNLKFQAIELLIVVLPQQFFLIFQFLPSKSYFNPLNFILIPIIAEGFHPSIKFVIQVILPSIKVPFSIE